MSLRRVVVLALLVCGAVPAGAHAAELTVTLPPDVAADVPFAVVVHGTAAPGDRLDIGFPSLPGQCDGAGFDDEIADRLPVDGTFRFELQAVRKAAGPETICAYVTDARGDEVTRASGTMTVREPRTDVRILAPPVVALDWEVAVTISGTAEATRDLTTRLAPPGTPCDGAPREGIDPVGPGAFALRSTHRLHRFGTWRICVETARGFAIHAPDLRRFELPVRVSLACTRASRALSRARDRWRLRSRQLALAGRPPDARLRRLGGAIRQARAGVRAGCREGQR